MSLTDEDRTWITNTVERIVERVTVPFATKADLERITAPFATKADLERVTAPFATREQLEAVETRILTEFHKWASPLEARVKSHSAVAHALELEIDAVKDRISKLEGKKAS